MLKKDILKSFVACAAFMLSGCATAPDGSRTWQDTVVDIASIPDRFFATLQGKEIITERTWYKGTPGYKKNVAPYILDQERFATFMNKYKKPRVLSEEEKLQVIVQLGIYQYVPQWLKPEAKAKIEKMLKQAKVKKTAYLIHKPILLASAGGMDPLTGASSSSDVPVNQMVVASAGELTMDLMQFAPQFGGGALTAGGAGAAATMTNLIGETALAIPILVGGTAFAVGFGISAYLIPAAYNALVDYVDNVCKTTNSCGKYEVPDEPKALPPPKAVTATKVGNGKCPPEDEQRLHDWYKNICDNRGTCKGTYTKQTNEAIIKKNLECLNSRGYMTDICYDGVSDDGHKRQLINASETVKKCYEILNNRKIYPQPQ